MMAPAAPQPDRPVRAEAQPVTSGSGAYAVDDQRKVVVHRSSLREFRLSRLEFNILRYLHYHAGRVVPADELLEWVWFSRDDAEPESVRVAVMKLRRKIAPDVVETWKGDKVHCGGYLVRSPAEAP